MRMKKLLMFLVLLTISISSWAQITVSDASIMHNGSAIYYGKEISGLSAAGSLATYLGTNPSAIAGQDYLVVSGGELNADDLNALLSLSSL